MLFQILAWVACVHFKLKNIQGAILFYIHSSDIINKACVYVIIVDRRNINLIRDLLFLLIPCNPETTQDENFFRHRQISLLALTNFVFHCIHLKSAL